MDIETVAMTIIAYSGDARGQAFQALGYAKSRDFKKAYEIIEVAKEESVKAHQAQTELLFSEANGNKIEMNILLVHAQDHLMSSMLAIELIIEMIRLYESCNS